MSASSSLALFFASLSHSFMSCFGLRLSLSVSLFRSVSLFFALFRSVLSLSFFLCYRSMPLFHTFVLFQSDIAARLQRAEVYVKLRVLYPLILVLVQYLKFF